MMVNIGFGNIVSSERVIAMVAPESAPVKRIVQHGKEQGIVVDATQGRKTKAVLLMEDNRIILSALKPETIAQRAETLTGEEE